VLAMKKTSVAVPFRGVCFFGCCALVSSLVLGMCVVLVLAVLLRGSAFMVIAAFVVVSTVA